MNPLASVEIECPRCARKIKVDINVGPLALYVGESRLTYVTVDADPAEHDCGTPRDPGETAEEAA